MLWAGSGRGLLLLPGHSWGSLDLLMTGEAGLIPAAWQVCGFSRVTAGSRREPVSRAWRRTCAENAAGWGWGAQGKPLRPQWCHDRSQPGPRRAAWPHCGQLHAQGLVFTASSVPLPTSLRHASAELSPSRVPAVPRPCLPVL